MAIIKNRIMPSKTMSNEMIMTAMIVCFVALALSTNSVSTAATQPPQPQPQQQHQWKCGTAAAKREVDEIVARIMTYGRVDRKFPQNSDEMKPYCKEQAQLMSKIDDYKTQCLTGQAKATVAVIVYSIKNRIAALCRKPNSKRTQALLATAKCANRATNEYDRCSNDYIDLLLAVQRDVTDNRERLAQMCCGYVRVFDCIRERASRMRPKPCTDADIDANIEYIRGYFDNASNLVCGDFAADSDRCERVRLLRRTNPNPSKRPLSYFHPLVDLLLRL